MKIDFNGGEITLLIFALRARTFKEENEQMKEDALDLQNKIADCLNECIKTEK